MAKNKMAHEEMDEKLLKIRKYASELANSNLFTYKQIKALIKIENTVNKIRGGQL